MKINSAVKRGLFIATAITLLFLVLWYFYGEQISHEKSDSPTALLDQMEQKGVPKFTVPDFDGKLFSLEPVQGKLILVNFWATWCAPCVTEFPSMIKMVKQMDGKVLMITLSADERKQDVLDFIKTFKGSVPNVIHLWDPEQKTAAMYGTTRLPESYLLAPDLRLIRKVVNSQDWSAPESISYLKSELSKLN